MGLLMIVYRGQSGEKLMIGISALRFVWGLDRSLPKIVRGMLDGASADAKFVRG